MLEALTRVVLRHRNAVLLAWLAVVVAGVFSSVVLPARLTALTAVPDSQSAQVNAILMEHFHENDDGAFTIVRHFGEATPEQISAMERSLSEAASEVPSAQVLVQRALAGTLFAVVGTKYSLLDASAHTQQLRDALARHGLRDVLVSGPPALEHDLRPLLADDLRNGTLLGVMLALLLLIAALGTARAIIVPFAVAAATVGGALCVILLIAQRFSMVLYIPNVVELIGLGLAIDYSLLVVHRHRAELAAGADDDEAVVRTMATAGRTVAVSGLTAAAGLSVLFLMPVPFVRSLGAAGLVVPALAVLVTLTLQPALLALLGRRGIAPGRLTGILASPWSSTVWARLAGQVQRKPGRLLTAGLLLLVLLAAPVAWMRVAPASLTAIRGQSESMRAVQYLTAHAGPGVITPHQIIVDLGHADVAASTGMDEARQRFARILSRLPESFAAVTDTTTLFTDAGGRYQRFIVIGRHGFDDPQTQAFVDRVRNLDPRAAGYPDGTRILVGGAPAQGVDFLERVFGAFPWIVLASLVLAYVIMARAFRSRRMPLIAVALNLLSVAAALGVVTLVFHLGMGVGIIGAAQSAHVEGWSLVFLFAMLFGLSMDYQVFLVARIREALEAGMPWRQSVAAGLGSTGAVISLAAVILMGALTGLALGHVTGLQQLGVGLALGVLIDATIVRGLVLPSALMLLDRSED